MNQQNDPFNSNQSIWDDWIDKCPKCGSIDFKLLNEFKGHYRKFNSLGLKNKRKCMCNECKHEFWIEI